MDGESDSCSLTAAFLSSPQTAHRSEYIPRARFPETEAIMEVRTSPPHSSDYIKVISTTSRATMILDYVFRMLTNTQRSRQDKPNTHRRRRRNSTVELSASASALCIEFATNSRRLPTGLVENLKTEHVENLLPNTHSRHDATVELSCVGGVY